MNGDQFDDLLKNKLESISTPLGVDTWSRFEKILDADADLHLDNEDPSFDKTIKQKISTNHHVGKDTQWQILKEKLNNIKHRKDSIYLSKVMELVAIFLIVFTLTNINGYILPFEEKAIQNIDTNYANLTKDNTTTTSLKNNKTNLPLSNKSFASSEIKVKSNLKTERNKVNQFSSVLVSQNDLEDTQIYNEKIGKDIDMSKGEVTFSLNSNPISHLEIPEVKTSDAVMGEYVNESLSNMEALNIKLIPIEIAPVYTEMASIFPMQITSNKAKSIKAISAFASADINLINTPFDKVYSIPSYTKEALNNAYGLRISTQKNNLEIESGLDYSRREYHPARFKEAFGNTSDVYFETSLDKITFDIASIPLNLKYHYINQPGWSSYLMVGVALNLIANASYEIPTTLVEGRPSPDRYTPIRPRLEEKEFTKGLLNGDAFKDNYFATAGFGIGFEKKIYKNTSIYIQPSYHRHLLTPGIGPKNDKIHTSSLQFGVKTIL